MIFYYLFTYAALNGDIYGQTLSSHTFLAPARSCTLARAALAVPAAGLADIAKIARFLLLWLLLQMCILLLCLLRILRHNRLRCWLYYLLFCCLRWQRDLRRWRGQCGVAVRRLAQASVVDTDLGKVKGGLRIKAAHLDDKRSAGNGDTLSRVETAKHFRLNLSGRALLHHSDLVTLFPGSIVKRLFPVVHHKNIWCAAASVDFERVLSFFQSSSTFMSTKATNRPT
jgi:hypothetical protein